jgi:hypothetical protein
MNTDKIIELLFFCLPALITGGVAYYFFQMFTKNEERRRHFALARRNQKHALPLRLQAYERMALYMERIDPAKMLIRITPISDDKNDYVNYVVAQIEQEYEHNLTQQIYMSDDCWGIITTSKNATIQMLRKTALSNDVTDANKLRETVLRELFENPAPSTTALAYIKNEVKSFL